MRIYCSLQSLAPSLRPRSVPRVCRRAQPIRRKRGENQEEGFYRRAGVYMSARGATFIIVIKIVIGVSSSLRVCTYYAPTVSPFYIYPRAWRPALLGRQGRRVMGFLYMVEMIVVFINLWGMESEF